MDDDLGFVVCEVAGLGHAKRREVETGICVMRKLIEPGSGRSCVFLLMI
jgi:hypothetical protein